MALSIKKRIAKMLFSICLSAALLTFASCDEHKSDHSMNYAVTKITSGDVSILGFEDSNDWSGASLNSTNHSQGEQSLEVSVTGWTEVSSVSIANVGPVGEEVSIDVLMPNVTPWWGEIIMKLEVPSQGFQEQEIGRANTIGRSSGVFETYTFNLSPQVRAILNGTYSDLKITVVVNAPDGTYLLDNIQFSEGVAPDTDLSEEDVQLKVFVRYEGTHEDNYLKPRMYVRNVGDVAIRNFKVYYYFSIEHGQEPIVEDYWTPFCDVYIQRLNEIQYRVVYDYEGYTLPAGGIVPNDSGNSIGLHYKDDAAWDKTDDLSYDGVSETFVETNNVVIVGEAGELLHGQIPTESGAYKTHHGMSLNTLNERNADDGEYVTSGYTISYIDAYSDETGEARFSAIWRKCGHPAASAFFDMTSDEYQKKFDEYVDDLGYRLVSVDGYNDIDGTPLFAAIFHKVTGTRWTSHHNMTQDTLNAVSATQEEEYSSYPTAINGYVGPDGKSLYAAIWERTGSGEPVVEFDTNHNDYQSNYNSKVAAGYTITHLDVHNNNGTTVFVSIWERLYETKRAVHGQTHDEYQVHFDNLMYSGHRLDKVTGYLEDNVVKYGAFWTPVYLSVADWRYIKDEVEAEMDAKDIPAASVAISRRGKLLYAQGFGRANGSAIGPYHRMRIASVSKSITGAAILRLTSEFPQSFAIDPTKDPLEQTVFGPNGILGTNYGTAPYSPFITQMTVGDFLEHTTGNWVGHGYTSDPSGSRTFGNPTNPLNCNPIHQYEDIDTLISQVLDNSIDFDGTNAGQQAWVGTTPGLTFEYSNFGYLVLGEIIEQVSGIPYEDYVQDRIFDPLGISRTALSEYVTFPPAPTIPAPSVCDTRDDATASLLPMEVDYPVDDDARNIRRMGAHGGWVAPAMDIVRFAWQQSGDFGTQDANGIDDENAVNEYGLTNREANQYRSSEISPPGGENYAKGVRIEPVGTDAYRWFHGGTLDGTKARFWCQTDDPSNPDPELNGFCLTMIVNTHFWTDAAGTEHIINHEDFEIMLRRVIQNVSHWPDVDHFYGNH